MKYFRLFLFSSIYLSLFLNTANSQTTINLASQCNCEVLSGTVVPAPGAPTANAGNLYINTTTGEIYSFDGTTWTAVSEDTPDHDWYVVGGTTPPTSINNNITTEGRVGIGVANPLYPLHVGGAIRSDARRYFFGTGANLFVNGSSDLVYTSNSASVSKLRFYDSDIVFYGAVVGTSDGTNFGLNDKDNHWTFRSVHDQFLTMSIDNSEKVRILANGRMGIGTAGPTATLDVDGNARIRTLATGAATEMELVVDGNGVIKKRMAGDNSSTNELPAAGKDTDVTGNTVDIEPQLDFVHTVNSPDPFLNLHAQNKYIMGLRNSDGAVGIGTTAILAGFHVNHEDGILMEGTFGSGRDPKVGAGTRLIWSPKNAAFRAGTVNGTQWNEVNVGNYSAGFGFSTRASGGFSFAGGNNAVADGDYSFAYGLSPTATGANSLAIGKSAKATNVNTIALGQGTVSNGNSTIAIGYLATASGTGSKTFGAQTLSTGFNAIAMGEHLFARSRGEISLGSYGTDYTPASASTWNGGDRILNVGVGLDSMNRKDAFTIHKDGRSRFNGYAEIFVPGSTNQEGIFISNSGTGIGQLITMANGMSNAVALRLFNNGLATGQDIIMNNAMSTANGFYLRHNGLGIGQQLVMNNAASTARGLDIVNKGLGAGLYISQQNANNSNTYAAVFHSGNVVANEVGGNFDFRVESDTRTHSLWVDASTDIVNFGSNSTFATSNGTVIGGTTVQYVADFDIGVNEGTAIGIGSIEFLLDNVAETTINNSFSPATHITRDLGFSTTVRAWDDVYADDFVNVSDLREKENIKDLSYGLSEIMDIRTISYTLKDDPFSESKLGVIAQDVLPLVSEAVKTHDYKILDEQKGEHELVEMDRMGVKYQQLIPVLIKGIQEQQDQISTLTESNEDLTKKNQALSSEIEEMNEKLEKIMLMLERKD